MRRPRLLLAVVLLAMLGAMAAKSLLVQPPPVREHNAPGAFDANRAKARLAFVLGDQRPHPSDSDADDQVRARLVTLLRQMGLNPIVRDQLACNELYKQRGVSCARVRNVIAIVGSPTGPALLLNAHYDSTPVGPAAADDGAGVATLLEVASIMKDRPAKRPIIFLFNEGEELGLVGARAFLGDPLSRNVDSLVNLEARGVRGPVNMFETSRPNAAPIGLFKQAVASPIANSLSTDVYRLMPNYTDVNSFSERGWLTLNLAPIGNETRYHSPGDDLAALDLATLQHMGDQTLALTENLSSGRPSGGGDRIFMDLAGRGLITLPLVVGAGLLIGLLIGFVVISLRRGGLARGAVVTVGTMVGSAALSWLALALIGAVRSGMFWRAHAIWTNLATYASVTLVGVVLIASVGRRTEVPQLRPAFWFVYLVLGGVIGLIAPGGIIFFLFPPLLAVAGMLAGRWWRPGEGAGSAAALLFLYLTWGAMLGLLEELLNSGPMWLFGPLGALLILPVLIEAKPLIEAARLRSAAILAGTIALITWAASAAAPAYSADRQQRLVIQHVTDSSSGKSWWSVVNDRARLPEAMRRLSGWHFGKLPATGRPSWLAPAPTDPSLHPAAIQIIQVSPLPDGRRVQFRLVTNGASGVAVIGPPDARIKTAGVEGFVRPIGAEETGKYFLECFGRSCDGAAMEFTTASRHPVQFTITALRPGLPPFGLKLVAARPPFARPQYLPDATVIITRVRL
jgi:Peptidase family M28